MWITELIQQGSYLVVALGSLSWFNTLYFLRICKVSLIDKALTVRLFIPVISSAMNSEFSKASSVASHTAINSADISSLCTSLTSISMVFPLYGTRQAGCVEKAIE